MTLRQFADSLLETVKENEQMKVEIIALEETKRELKDQVILLDSVNNKLSTRNENLSDRIKELQEEIKELNSRQRTVDIGGVDQLTYDLKKGNIVIKDKIESFVRNLQSNPL